MEKATLGTQFALLVGKYIGEKLLKLIYIFRCRLKQIEQMDCVVARERKQNQLLDRQIAELKVNVDEKHFTKDSLIDQGLITSER